MRPLRASLLRVSALVVVCCVLVGPRKAHAASDPVGYVAALLVTLIAEGVDRYGGDIANAASFAADALVRAEAGLPPIARGTLHRARRAIAIGPRGGLATSYSPSASRGELALSLGLALEVFEGPILPSAEELRAWLVEGLQARMVAVARDLAARGGPPLDQAALMPYAREILATVHADVASRMAVPHRWFPPPRFGIAIEAGGHTSSDSVELRLTVGLGIGPVSVGPTVAFRADKDDPGVFVGAEVAGHLITKRTLRTPVLDAFLRLDLAAKANPATAHQGTVGLRLLLDVL